MQCFGRYSFCKSETAQAAVFGKGGFMMSDVLLFPFSDYWGVYLGFIGFVFAMLMLDLGVFHKNSHVVTIKESISWSAAWISLALIFNVGLYFYALSSFAQDARLTAIPGFDTAVAAKQVGVEFFTGFLIEKALAVDNIFIFIVVFSYFAIPAQYQHRVLFFGILGALVFRAGFIAIGSVLMKYDWVVIAAGAFLILTGIKILFAPEKPTDPGSNPVIKFVKRVVPMTSEFDGQKFFTRKNGILVATPLFLALVFIEFTDIVFAIDSVPAIFAITKEPLIVFTSNIFAILGLRSLYFLMAGVADKFRYLKYGLGFILVFVGLKMVWLNEAFGGKFPIGWSLGIIASILAVSIASSLLIKPTMKGVSAEK
jgi:tellurite resistance protein TerC